MRIRKVSDNEISVFLSEQELDFFDIHPEEKIPKSGELHRFLYAVMEAVQDETGFDPYNDGQVMVEASPVHNGMNLIISKLGAGRAVKKLTRDQFKRVKAVRVRESKSRKAIKDFDELADALGIRDIIRSEEQRRKYGMNVFIFDCFSDMEDALSLMPRELAGSCSLFRNKKSYALITPVRNNTKIYNMLTEYSVSASVNEVLANDIREGWLRVAEGEKLSEMADAVRSMK